MGYPGKGASAAVIRSLVCTRAEDRLCGQVRGNALVLVQPSENFVQTFRRLFKLSGASRP